MKKPELPPLSEDVTFLGGSDKPGEISEQVNGVWITTLWARYRVHGLDVRIGWTIGSKLGNFRNPDRLLIGFDAEAHTREHGHEYPPSAKGMEALDGISTSFLRALPMAHARALMRERHEQLSVAEMQGDWTPLPSRVDSDRDYIHVAGAYVALGSASVEPLKRLKDWSGESVETWGARLKRARARGILIGKGRDAFVAPEYVEQLGAIQARIRTEKDMQ